MNKILELSERLAARKAEMRALIAACGSGETARAMTDEERTKFDAAKAEAEALAATLDRARSIDSDDPSKAPSAIGLTDNEARSFSLVRAIAAAASQDWRGAEFEREVTNTVADQLGRAPRGALGFILPNEVAHVRAEHRASDVVKGTATSGGNLIATELLSASLIDMLRNRLVLQAAGARYLGGLVGDVVIPKVTGGATAYWGAEDDSATSSGQAFGTVSLTPKTVFGTTQISRKMLLQSSVDINALVRDDLARVLAGAIDLAGLHGAGTSAKSPFGIASTTGIGSVVGGTDGAALTFAHLVGLETEVAVDNADLGSLAYITNAKVRGAAKQTPKIGTAYPVFLWAGGEAPLNDYPAYITNAVSSTLTKGTSSGVCSALFFGNFADLLIGVWGNGLDVIVDPFTAAKSGAVVVTAMQDADVAVRHPESFAAMLDVTTS